MVAMLHWVRWDLRVIWICIIYWGLKSLNTFNSLVGISSSEKHLLNPLAYPLVDRSLWYLIFCSSLYIPTLTLVWDIADEDFLQLCSLCWWFSLLRRRLLFSWNLIWHFGSYLRYWGFTQKRLAYAYTLNCILYWSRGSLPTARHLRKSDSPSLGSYRFPISQLMMNPWSPILLVLWFCLASPSQVFCS